MNPFILRIYFAHVSGVIVYFSICFQVNDMGARLQIMHLKAMNIIYYITSEYKYAVNRLGEAESINPLPDGPLDFPPPDRGGGVLRTHF